MRLDKFLKVSRLIKRRTVANEACDAGRVLVNGKTAKASVKVKPGDVMRFSLEREPLRLRFLNCRRQQKKKKQRTYLNTCKVCQTTGMYKSINGYCFQ